MIRTDSEIHNDIAIEEWDHFGSSTVPSDDEGILITRERIGYNYVLPLVQRAQSYRIIIFSIINVMLAAIEYAPMPDSDDIKLMYEPSRAITGIFCTLGLLLANLMQKPSLGIPYVAYIILVSSSNYLELIQVIVVKYGRGWNLELLNLVWLIFFFAADISFILTVSKVIYYEWTMNGMKSFNKKLMDSKVD